ncbi:MAG: hypothetical protein AAF799_16425 [Myxococcota bacterium]
MRVASRLIPSFLLVVGCTDPTTPVSTGTTSAGTGTGDASTSGNASEPDSSDDGTPLLCGNLVVDLGEECDEGPFNDDFAECTSDCRLNVCGDGHELAGIEECDEGANNGDSGACLADCTLGTCGDGRVMTGVEECDEGASNGDGTSTCREDCGLNVCGDGYVLTSDEACDDGEDNGNGFSECTSACTLNVCGDGYHQEAEACDDGGANGDGLSPCRTDCELNECGDGYHHTPSEDCEDGNLDPGDGCGAYCTVPAPVVAVANGVFHSCALLETNRVKCWGHGDDGQLGFGDGAHVYVPAERGTTPLPTTVEQVAVGVGHTCVLLTGGELRCFGWNDYGQLGLGDTDRRGLLETAMDVEPVPLGAPAIYVAAGNRSTCAVLQGGTVRCWGQNTNHYLGLPGLTEDLGDDEAITRWPEVDVGGPAQSVHMGGSHICVLLDDGQVQCWGQATSGQTGHPETIFVGDDETPAEAGPVDIGGPALDVATGDAHTCALLAGGDLRCFGRNATGALGHGHTDDIGDDELPNSVPFVPVGAAVADVEAGAGFVCVRTLDDDLRCWGQAYQGRIGLPGLGDVGDDELASSVPNVDIGADIIGLSSKDHGSCAITSAGNLRCWGWGTAALGYGLNPSFGNLGDDEDPASAGDVPLF